MNEQEKKRQRIYYLLNADTKPKFLCLLYTKQRKSFAEKDLFNVKVWRYEKKNRREGFLTALASEIKENPHNINKKAL